MNNPIIIKTLTQLGKSCPGILGSFIISEDGVVTEKVILVELFSDCDFDQIASCISDIYLALADPASAKLKATRSFNDIEMKFNSLSLICRGMSTGYLLIILDIEANLTKVNGMSNIAIRRIEQVYKNKQ